jgi:hypothetical protein
MWEAVSVQLNSRLWGSEATVGQTLRRSCAGRSRNQVNGFGDFSDIGWVFQQRAVLVAVVNEMDNGRGRHYVLYEDTVFEVIRNVAYTVKLYQSLA